MTSDEELHFDVEETHGSTNLAVRGEIDLATAERFGHVLAELGRRGEQVRLDLSGVSFMDSCGLHVLIDAILTTGDRRSTVLVTKVSAPVLRVLRTTGLDAALAPAAELVPMSQPSPSSGA